MSVLEDVLIVEGEASFEVVEEDSTVEEEPVSVLEGSSDVRENCVVKEDSGCVLVKLIAVVDVVNSNVNELVPELVEEASSVEEDSDVVVDEVICVVETSPSVEDSDALVETRLVEVDVVSDVAELLSEVVEDASFETEEEYDSVKADVVPIVEGVSPVVGLTESVAEVTWTVVLLAMV